MDRTEQRLAREYEQAVERLRRSQKGSRESAALAAFVARKLRALQNYQRKRK